MKSKVKGPGKVLLILLIVGALIGGKYFFMDSKWAISHKDAKESVVLQAVVLPDAPRNAEGKNVTPAEMPTDVIASVAGPKLVLECMAWNAQMPLMFANGGVNTTEGSLMAKNGVNLTIKRLDDCGQMATNL